MIGVSNVNVDVNKPLYRHATSLMLYTNDGALRSNGPVIKSLGDSGKFGQGDSVTVEVDCASRNVVVIVKGVRLNPEPLPASINPPFRFSVDFHGPGSIVTIDKGHSRPQ